MNKNKDAPIQSENQSIDGWMVYMSCVVCRVCVCVCVCVRERKRERERYYHAPDHFTDMITNLYTDLTGIMRTKQ